MFSLEEIQLKKVIIALLKYLKDCHIENGDDLFSFIPYLSRHGVMDLYYRKADSN